MMWGMADGAGRQGGPWPPPDPRLRAGARTRPRVLEMVGVSARPAPIIALLIGGVAEWYAWRALVPWDLSEEDKLGRVIIGRSDPTVRILVAVIVATAVWTAVGLLTGRARIVTIAT